MNQGNSIHIVDIALSSNSELDRLIKVLKCDPKLTTTTSLKKFEKTPYKYDFWYSKSKLLIKAANKDDKIFDLIDKLLKMYDKVSD